MRHTPKHPDAPSPISSKDVDALSAVMDQALSADEQLANDELDVAEHSPQDSPPPYDEPVPTRLPRRTRVPSILAIFRRLESVQWSKYVPPGAQITNNGDRVTLAVSMQDCRQDHVAKLLIEQLSLPPQQFVRLEGHLITWYTTTPIDFDLTLNLTPYLVPKDECIPSSVVVQGRAGRATSHDEIKAMVDELVEDCFKDTSKPQSIIIRRSIQNWDRDTIMNRLHGLLGTLHYRGKVVISFPIKQCQMQLNLRSAEPVPATAQRGFLGNFRLSLPDPPTVRTVSAQWDYASSTGFESADRTFASKSESAWFQEWEPVIRRSVVRKERGQLGLDAWVLNMTDPLTKAEMPCRDWGNDK